MVRPQAASVSRFFALLSMVCHPERSAGSVFSPLHLADFDPTLPPGSLRLPGRIGPGSLGRRAENIGSGQQFNLTSGEQLHELKELKIGMPDGE
ncbi:MAG: hypothetical protein ACRD2O_02930 [Terriglobia bacterium]